MKARWLLWCAATLLTAFAAAAADETADREFEALARGYIEKLLEMEPERATRLGDHRFDSRLDDYTKQGFDRRRALAQTYLKELGAIAPQKLSATNNVDYRILKTRLEYRIFQLDVLRDYEWDPLRYNVSNAIYELVARDFAPLEVRRKNIAERLKQVPAVLAAAKANLKNPPRIHTETAIKQNAGTISLVRNEVGSLGEPQAAAVAALEEYGRWLEQDLLPRSNGDFRLGDEKYRVKLAFELDSDLTKEEILRRAEADLKKTQGAMYEVAKGLYKGSSTDTHVVIKAVLDKLAESRPNNDTIVGLAEKTLVETTRFVREKKLVTVPEEPVKIVVMPEFDRGVAVAYCRSAAPLEPKGETFYAISPTPKDWTPQRVESFFREYNDYMVHDLTIHEAMPGHYLQIAHANKFKAPTQVRTIFRSGPFIEGWAVYAEEVMADAGYGGPEVRMQQLKMRLRSIINSIIDQKVHTAGMTEQEALKIMMEEGFQEEGEAAGKWTRVRLTSAQLSTYFVGSLGVTDLRREYEAKRKGAVDVRKMHDLMLSFGAPPVKYVREMMSSSQ